MHALSLVRNTVRSRAQSIYPAHQQRHRKEVGGEVELVLGTGSLWCHGVRYVRRYAPRLAVYAPW